jgi:hypothetical protein
VLLEPNGTFFLPFVVPGVFLFIFKTFNLWFVRDHNEGDEEEEDEW